MLIRDKQGREKNSVIWGEYNKYRDKKVKPYKPDSKAKKNNSSKNSVWK